MKESAFQRAAIAYLRGQPESYWNVNHGGIFSGSGRFDIEGCMRGVYIAFELKTELGRISKAQDDHFMRIDAAGGYPFFVRNMAELKRSLDYALRQENK